jgi:hypothetical protein
MSQKIVMIMIMAWILASIIGVLMTLTGFVEALIWISDQLSLNGISLTYLRGLEVSELEESDMPII